MNRCHRLFNALKSFARVMRFCMKPKFIPLTNTGYCDPSDQPKSIVTWNIQGLFYFMSKDKQDNIIRELQNFDQDIICLQEVFEDSLKELIIYELRDKYPYYLLGNVNKRYVVGDDSGLLVLSKYRIEFMRELILDEYVFPDRMASKSIMYFKVGNLNLVTCHLQSNNMYDNNDISYRQIKMIKEKSPFDSYIVTGDLNHNEAYLLLDQFKNNYDRTWGETEILDYIVPINYSTMNIRTQVSDMDISNTSDHYPLMCTIEYSSN